MKTHGICNAKSARKHRKQGHSITRLLDGRYRWDARKKTLIGTVTRMEGVMFIDEFHTMEQVKFADSHICKVFSIQDAMHVQQQYPKGSQWLARKRNAASKPVTVTSVNLRDNRVIIEWSQGTKSGADTPQEFAQRVTTGYVVSPYV